MRQASQPHWHIDYLRRHTCVAGVFFESGGARLEHEWAGILAGLPGVSVPLGGFGSSDCGCASHLFFFRKAPSARRLMTALSAEFVKTAE